MIFDIGALLTAYRRGKSDPRLVAEQLSVRLQRLEPTVHAFLQIDARWTERLGQSVLEGALYGIALGIKDLIDVAGMTTTGGSRAYRLQPTEDAPVVAALRSAGGTVVGKTNTQELAFGVLTPGTTNPWNREHIAGGSSGGSAAALAAGMVLGALGSDTAGSVRIPAALCGVVGFKPSTGLLSRRGVMPLSTTLDHIGPLAHTVDGVRRLFLTMVGEDEADPGSRTFRPARRTPNGRVAVPWSYFAADVQPNVRSAVEEAVGVLESLGYRVEEVPLAPWETWRNLLTTLRLPEALHYHRPALNGPQASLFGQDLPERLWAGAEVRAIDYLAAQAERQNLRHATRAAMERFDAWLLPTTNVTAPRIGDSEVSTPSGPMGVWEALVRCTTPFNVLGLPAISLPAGQDALGLPIGVQLVGHDQGDMDLLALAEAYEQTSGHRSQVVSPEIA